MDDIVAEVALLSLNLTWKIPVTGGPLVTNM